MHNIQPYSVDRSMYFDEDGDLAHEFYIEVRTANGTTMQKRPLEHLRPQVSILFASFELKS